MPEITNPAAIQIAFPSDLSFAGASAPPPSGVYRFEIIKASLWQAEGRGPEGISLSITRRLENGYEAYDYVNLPLPAITDPKERTRNAKRFATFLATIGVIPEQTQDGRSGAAALAGKTPTMDQMLSLVVGKSGHCHYLPPDQNAGKRRHQITDLLPSRVTKVQSGEDTIADYRRGTDTIALGGLGTGAGAVSSLGAGSGGFGGGVTPAVPAPASNGAGKPASPADFLSGL